MAVYAQATNLLHKDLRCSLDQRYFMILLPFGSLNVETKRAEYPMVLCAVTSP